MMTKRTKTLIVLVLLAMGTDFALDRIIVQRLNRGDFVPVRRRIELEKGFQLTQVFTVNHAADYEVGLECKRALPHDDLNGLLQSNLNLTYAVFETYCFPPMPFDAKLSPVGNPLLESS